MSFSARTLAGHRHMRPVQEVLRVKGASKPVSGLFGGWPFRRPSPKVAIFVCGCHSCGEHLQIAHLQHRLPCHCALRWRRVLHSTVGWHGTIEWRSTRRYARSRLVKQTGDLAGASVAAPTFIRSLPTIPLIRSALDFSMMLKSSTASLRSTGCEPFSFIVPGLSSKADALARQR